MQISSMKIVDLWQSRVSCSCFVLHCSCWSIILMNHLPRLADRFSISLHASLRTQITHFSFLSNALPLTYRLRSVASVWSSGSTNIVSHLSIRLSVMSVYQWSDLLFRRSNLEVRTQYLVGPRSAIMSCMLFALPLLCNAEDTAHGSQKFVPKGLGALEL
jgi:hypothetical protein